MCFFIKPKWKFPYFSSNHSDTVNNRDRVNNPFSNPKICVFPSTFKLCLLVVNTIIINLLVLICCGLLLCNTDCRSLAVLLIILLRRFTEMVRIHSLGFRSRTTINNGLNLAPDGEESTLQLLLN